MPASMQINFDADLPIRIYVHCDTSLFKRLKKRCIFA